MCAKSSLRFDAVFVDDSETAKVIMLRGIVASGMTISTRCGTICMRHYSPCEVEGVEGLQPTVVGMATLITRARNKLHGGDRGG